MREKADKSSLSLRKKLILAGVIFFFLVLLITSFFGKKGLLEVYNAQRHYEDLLRRVERLEQEKIRLEREIEELMKNPKAVDKEAREKLWLIKPDEKVVIKSQSK